MSDSQISVIPISDERLTLKNSSRLSFALTKTASSVVKFLLRNKFWKPVYNKVLKPFDGYTFMSRWTIPKLFKWQVANNTIACIEGICQQGIIAVLPSLLAPAAYGYEEELSADSLFSFFSSDKCHVNSLGGRKGVCVITPNGEAPVLYLSPGVLVCLNTMLNIYAYVLEFGFREVLWQSLVGEDKMRSKYAPPPLETYMWGARDSFSTYRKLGKKPESDFTELFLRSYVRNDAVALPAINIAKRLVRKLSAEVSWLEQYNQDYRSLRARHLPLLTESPNVEGLKHLRGEIALI